MAPNAFNWKTLIAIGLLAGLIQVAVGVAMYVAGVYFSAWSIFISLFVLLLCVFVGTRWYRDSVLKGRITYRQALVAGIVISVCTGIVYAIYNLISISFIYSGFLDRVIALNAGSPLRQSITANTIALSNLIRLSVIGTILAAFASLILRSRSSR
jgi:hypothetical protein